MKKLAILIIIVGLIGSIAVIPTLSTVNETAAHADNTANGQAVLENASKARALYVIDYDSGTVIMKKEENKRYPIASMVKIMTLLMTYNAIDSGELKLDEKVTISDYAAGMGGSQMFLNAGDSYTVSDLIKGVTVASANDAATALGERISGNIESFVADMNAYAKELGLSDTLFCNATGLPNSGEQYSTAHDVTVMMRKLLTKPTYYSFSKIWLEKYKHADGRETDLTNTNKLVRFYKGCDAGKTGFTNNAMYCISASAVNKDTRVIVTVLGEPDSKTRFKEVSDMFNYCFANYSSEVVIRKGETIRADVNVAKAKKATISLYADGDLKVFSDKRTKRGYKVDFVIDEGLRAPVKQAQRVGKAVITDENGQVISTADICAADEIQKKTYFDAITEVLREWFVK